VNSRLATVEVVNGPPFLHREITSLHSAPGCAVAHSMRVSGGMLHRAPRRAWCRLEAASGSMPREDGSDAPSCAYMAAVTELRSDRCGSARESDLDLLVLAAVDLRRLQSLTRCLAPPLGRLRFPFLRRGRDEEGARDAGSGENQEDGGHSPLPSGLGGTPPEPGRTVRAIRCGGRALKRAEVGNETP
jgi:hypothetical protein